MKNTFQRPIERACAVVGGQASLAKYLQVTPAVISQWIKGIRPIPVIHCVAIERATSGVVTRKDLRPDDWQKIWPEFALPEPTSTDLATTTTGIEESEAARNGGISTRRDGQRRTEERRTSDRRAD